MKQAEIRHYSEHKEIANGDPFIAVLYGEGERPNVEREVIPLGTGFHSLEGISTHVQRMVENDWMRDSVEIDFEIAEIEVYGLEGQIKL